MLLLMPRFVTSCLFLFISLGAIAGTVTGTITDTKGVPLPFASISVKGTSRGVVANSGGRYSITLQPGQYTLVCQFVGYQAVEKGVTVTAASQELDFTLREQELAMDEVVIRQGEDPAIAIMRETIKKRSFYNNQVDSFTVDVYIKGLMRSRGMPDKFLGQKIDKSEMAREGIDSAGKGILFLSESETKVSFTKPDRIKYEVLSSRASGGGLGISFPFFINFYDNNVSIFNNSLNPRGFISPISENAFHYYKFRYEGNFFEGDRMINKIRVTPRRRHEPLFNGYIQVVDGEWRIHSLELATTSDYALELLDTIRITQIHAPVTADTWRTQNQVVYVAAKKFGFDITGNFLNVYNNYNLDPGFGKKHFNRIVMSYDTAFNKKDSAYWNRVRPVPLEPDEKQNFVFRDSLFQSDQDSMFSKSRIDSLRRHGQKIKVKDFFAGGVTRHIYTQKGFLTYRIEPLIKELEYNTVEGLSAKLVQRFRLNPRGGKFNYELNWNARYGFSNRHLNSFGVLSIRPRGEGYRNRYLQFSGGKRLSQFNPDNPIDARTNMFYTLFDKRNYMKLYEAWFGGTEYHTRFENGLRLRLHAVYEDRLPVQNTTDFSFFNKKAELLPNHPFELSSIPFARHQALVGAVTFSFQPGQRYIQYPNFKMPIGSSLPTFEVQYAHGFKKILSSDVDFDRWRFSVYDDMNLKIGGSFHYRISAGGFLNAAQVEIPDFQHFNGNQTFYNVNYLNSFQLAPYYRYSTTEKLYGLAHMEHHFNGLLTNKIPFFNRLKWHLVGGSNTFYINRNNYYVEVFAGIENILKIFRVDFVTAYQSQPGNAFGIRVGMGGIIGGAIQKSIEGL